MSVGGIPWPTSQDLYSARLDLERLHVDHADEMAPLLHDRALHTFIGGAPSTQPELGARYRRQSHGRSPDGSQGWLNWVIRRRADGQAVGTVQATVARESTGLIAEVAWVVALPFQNQGYAREGGLAVVTWLREQEVTTVRANVHPEHEASQRVARALGMSPTEVVVDGETRWQL